MDPDFDSINNFIDNKIDNYNKTFEDFEKYLNIQDNTVKKICSDKVNETIKKNPKKTAKNLINLTKINESDDTSENSYILEEDNIETINNQLLKKVMKGGNYNNNVDLVDDEVEIIEETVPTTYDKSLDSYYPLIYGFYGALIIYIIIYLLGVYFELEVDKLVIFFPLITLTKIVMPKSVYYLESTK